MNKFCKHCEQDRPIEEFYKKELTRATMCTSCKKNYNKKRYAKIKKLLKKGTSYNGRT